MDRQQADILTRQGVDALRNGDAMQARALTGLGRAAPRWMVEGDDGIALVELAPTMVSGKLHMVRVLHD